MNQKNNNSENSRGGGKRTKTVGSTIRHLFQGLVKNEKKNLKIHCGQTKDHGDNEEVSISIKTEDNSKTKRNGSADSSGSRHGTRKKKKPRRKRNGKTTENIQPTPSTRKPADRTGTPETPQIQEEQGEINNEQSNQKLNTRKNVKSRRSKIRPLDPHVQDNMLPRGNSYHKRKLRRSPSTPSPVTSVVRDFRPATPRPQPPNGSHTTSRFGVHKDNSSRTSLETVAEREAETTKLVGEMADHLLGQFIGAPDSDNTKKSDSESDVCSEHTESGASTSKKCTTRQTSMETRQNENGYCLSTACTSDHRVPKMPGITKETHAVMNVLEDYISNIEKLIEIQVCKSILSDTTSSALPTSYVNSEVFCSSCISKNNSIKNNDSNTDYSDSDFADKKEPEYSDDVTRDVDRIIDEIENNWWYH